MKRWLIPGLAMLLACSGGGATLTGPSSDLNSVTGQWLGYYQPEATAPPGVPVYLDLLDQQGKITGQVRFDYAINGGIWEPVTGERTSATIALQVTDQRLGQVQLNGALATGVLHLQVTGKTLSPATITFHQGWP